MIEISINPNVRSFSHIFAPREMIEKSFEFLKANIEIGHVVFACTYLSQEIWYKIHADGELEYAYSAYEPYRHLGIIKRSVE